MQTVDTLPRPTGRVRRSRGPAAHFVYEAIRSAIVSGQFNEETRLTEEYLAGLFGVSRTPVREALFVLSAEGLIQPSRGRGFRIPRLAQEEVRDLYELQALIEGYAARRAAVRRSEEELAALRDLAERIDAAPAQTFRNQAEKSRWYMEQVSRFHSAVATASRNKRLQTLFAQVLETPLLMRVFFQRSPEELAQCNRYHQPIVNAIARRDSDQAEALMRAHLLEARDLVLAALAAEPEPPDGKIDS